MNTKFGMKNFQVSNNFKVVGVYTRGNYAKKQIIKYMF